MKENGAETSGRREVATGGPEVYPESVRKLSESWRQLSSAQQASAQSDSEVRGRDSEPRGVMARLKRYYLPIGLAIGLLIVALMTVLGGLAFLIWNAG
ncbi:MAG: hypothetical protein RIR52_952 [Acidobacteriota bacterium]